MIETLLITGAGPNGITGRIIKEYFINKCNILSPGSCELDLTNSDSVTAYFETHQIDYVIHCATFRPISTLMPHLVDEELESNLRMYYALASQSHRYKKMIYFGSGAEYDKTLSIVDIAEESFGRSIPKNKYGFGKYLMNLHCRKSGNIYNFRLFGTINPYERYSKNIVSNLCVKSILKLPISLKQNCRFSFVDIYDVLPLLEYSLKYELNYHDYNVVSQTTYLLSDIATYILELSDICTNIKFEKDGLNLEYTGNGKRLENEFNIHYTPIKESISKVYNYYLERKDCINVENIDVRWK